LEGREKRVVNAPAALHLRRLALGESESRVPAVAHAVVGPGISIGEHLPLDEWNARRREDPGGQVEVAVRPLHPLAVPKESAAT